MAGTAETVIEVGDLVKIYGGETRAVDQVSFDVDRGELFGFLGPNGAGKTTTIRMMATLLEPDEGRVLVDGIDVVEAPAEVRKILGFMPDGFGVYERITVEEYLDFFARAYDLRGSARQRASENVIEFMGIGELRDRDIESLSKGLKQRVALGRALIHDPQLLILDEPAANLDPRARIELATADETTRSREVATIWEMTNLLAWSCFALSRMRSGLRQPASVGGELG